ncbi:MAG: HRDC domain-containing protein [Victivallales bacterium]|nr:HRDC domain-containing protein [Victivallales bacterium]
MSFPLIGDNRSFTEFCRKASQQRLVAMDTEFVWVKTYYPILGLVQLAWDAGHCVLVDPMAVSDTAAFGELLANPDVCKVFHEASSDLPILHRWCGALPRNVVDTRFAAGFCGLTAKLSLAKLMELMLDVHLAKTETRTDWTQRPLTSAQLEYAGDDVARLPELYQCLEGKIIGCGNLEFFKDEMSRYEQSAFFEEPKFRDVWMRVSRPAARGLHWGPRELAILRELAAWRERQARTQNIAKTRVCKDEWLVALAQRKPDSLEQVYSIPGIWSSVVRQSGMAMLQAVRQGQNVPLSDCPRFPECHLDARLLRQRSDRLLALVRKRAEARGIDPCLVCSRREADSLVCAASRTDSPSSPLLQGWRHTLLAPAIDEICADFFAKHM